MNSSEVSMKALSLFPLIFSIVACSTLSNPNGALQPVVRKSTKEKIFYTTCSGSVEDWGSCYRKAKETCDKGYEVISRHEEVVGGKRELTFGCNP
jgi:hypothetical protein